MFEQCGTPSSKAGIGLLYVSMGKEREPGTCCWAGLSMRSKLGGAARLPVSAVDNYNRLIPKEAILLGHLSREPPLMGKRSGHAKFVSGSPAR